MNLVCTNNPSANDCRGLFGCTSGATVTVLATEDLADWTHAAEYPVDPVTGLCLPDLDPIPDNMFFKYKIILETE